MNLPSKKITKTQLARRVSLVSVALFFCFIPLSNWYANYKIGYNNSRLVGLASGQVAEYAYIVLDALYTLWDDPVRAATANNGSLWAYTVMGIPISDPIGLIAELITSVKFPIKYLLGAFIPFVITIIFGRIFCSWFCPMVMIFRLSKYLRTNSDKFGVPLLRLRVDPSTRAFVFWGGMILTVYMGTWIWHYLLPYITLSQEVFSLVIFSSFTAGVYYLVAVILLDFAVMPGEFCRSVCPTGFFLKVIGKFRPIRLKVDNSQCPKYCVSCQNSCELKLYPKEDAKLNDCHLCLKCVDACPKSILKVGVVNFRNL